MYTYQSIMRVQCMCSYKPQGERLPDVDALIGRDAWQTRGHIRAVELISTDLQRR